MGAGDMYFHFIDDLKLRWQHWKTFVIQLNLRLTLAAPFPSVHNIDASGYLPLAATSLVPTPPSLNGVEQNRQYSR